MRTSPLWVLLVTVGAGCGAHRAPAGPADGGAATDGGTDPNAISPYELSFDPIFDALPSGDAQLAKVCARGHGDLITTRMCATPTPTLRVLADLQHLVGLDFADETAAGQNGAAGNPAFVLSGHSSALPVRYVSAINPRMILFTPIAAGSKPDASFVSLAFTRGEQLIEAAAFDPTMNAGQGGFTFYMFRFRQLCNDAPNGCSKADLLTQSVEHDEWIRVDLYGDEDLVNTPVDCTSCHQSGGIGTPKILRMQERTAPYTHFFSSSGSGKALYDAFVAAHGTDEGYGVIPAPLVGKSDPAQLATLIERAGFAPQPNEFDSAAIESEVAATGASATWQGLYGNAVAGNAIAVPSYDANVADPTKLAAMTDSYAALRLGTAIRDRLPDIRDVLADAEARPMGIAPKADLDGQGILMQVCGQCHNDRLDQSVTRARFNPTHLATMEQPEKQRAIERLMLPANALGHMPPAQLRSLSADELTRVVGVLSN